MTEPKPPGLPWESWIDKQIREGMEAGAFDNLPGKGKPLEDIDRPHDELWWVRKKLAREDISYLPPSLAVRKELEDTRARISASDSEAEVRQLVDAINERIREVNRSPADGPPSTLMSLDADEVVTMWRGQRAAG